MIIRLVVDTQNRVRASHTLDPERVPPTMRWPAAAGRTLQDTIPHPQRHEFVELIEITRRTGESASSEITSVICPGERRVVQTYPATTPGHVIMAIFHVDDDTSSNEGDRPTDRPTDRAWTVPNNR